MRQTADRDSRRDRIRGGLFGGAVGDALGYPVEFLSLAAIRQRFGGAGVGSYVPDRQSGLALISDDTQMSLFTANGILVGDTRGCLRGIQGPPSGYVWESYRDWLDTQTGRRDDRSRVSWLMDVPALYSRRAPGGTCLSALESGCRGWVDRQVNDSKGCGGIMRVAPLGLRYDPAGREDFHKKLAREGAELAAVTHGHPLGYIPAAVLTHIVNTAVYGGCPRGDTLADAVEDAMDTAAALFGGDRYWSELRGLIDRAEAMAGNGREDAANIRALGEGWVAEETLAISIYCALRYEESFSAGIIAAVNHDGDSDSTGAVTGNILGAWLGYDAIEEKWKRDLELKDVILEMAADLARACPLTESECVRDPAWLCKYVEMKRFV